LFFFLCIALVIGCEDAAITSNPTNDDDKLKSSPLFMTVAENSMNGDGVIYACLTPGGQLAVVNKNEPLDCVGKNILISWNVTGPPGEQGEPGEPGQLSGWQRVAESFTISSTIFNNYSVFCPDEKLVTGGGYLIPDNDVENVNVIGSHPSFNGISWVFRSRAIDNPVENVTVYAICVDAE